MENKPRTDLWDDFAGDFLKVDLVKEFPIKLAVKGIEVGSIDGKPTLSIVTEYNNKTWKLSLNKTNQTFLRNNKISSPNDIVGKVLIFNKIKNRNPQGQIVDGFIIEKIEDDNTGKTK